MAAKIGGMGEGIYSCHPRQMITNKPLNINDEEVADGMARDGRPPSQPTTMSFAMQSIRLAEISRNIVDRSPLAMAHTGGLSHDAVMDIDTEMQTLINEVPAFFSMSESALMETYGLSRTRAENIVFQGKITYLLLYLHRCKLHLHYFSRSMEDPAYSSSREICLKYASLIIQSELWQENLDIDTEVGLKFTSLLIGVFLACLVLLLDLCVNPSSPNYEKQREEIRRSFKIIENAKNVSETTSKSVDSLVQVLQKYNDAPLNPDRGPQQQRGISSSAAAATKGVQQSQQIALEGQALNVPDAAGDEDSEIPFAGGSPGRHGIIESQDIAMPTAGPLNEADDDFSSYWTEFTQSFEQGIDVNSIDWDSLFLELDSSLI